MKSFKKLTALLLVVMLVFSMCITSLSVSAATTSDGTKVVYFVPNSNWKMDNARFAAYLFGEGEAWISVTDEDADGYYEAVLPEGVWDGLIFCRMNPSTTANNWTNRWNQTNDLTIPDDANCYTVAAGAWSYGSGTWGQHTPGEDDVEIPTEPILAYDYTVAGDVGLTGEAWNPAANGMTDEDGDGVYTITFKDVIAGSYSFKVTDGTWANSWGADGGNYSITLTKQADVTINFDSATKEIEVVSAGLGQFELKYIAVVGNGTKGSAWLNGEEWNIATTTNVLTDNGNGVWSITYNNVAASNSYQFKFIANDSYTYNWTSDGTFDGQTNPNNVVKHDGSTVTLTIDVSAYDFATKTGKVTTDFVVVPPTDAPTDAPTEPVEVDYYLFGYIDGADYGVGEDNANMGDYKFVDGTVTATFKETSYVGVKTTDNGWFMTDGWAGEVTEVTLYNSADLDTTADKLMVPAGKVKFNLVVNEDGTLTLSYTVVEQPTVPPTDPPTDPPTEAPTEAPVVKTDGYYVTGDINLKLTPSGTGKVRGTIALQAGTYNIKLNNYGTLLGYKKTVTNSSNGLTFKKTYGSFVTLNATGGTYTFQVNVDTNTLVIKYDSKLPEEYLVGDVNTILSPVAGKPLAIGTTYLEAGTYQFKISDDAVLLGNGGNCTDDTAGRSVTFKNTYSKSYTLNATGGNYTFTYYTSTGKLIIKHSPVKDEALDDVHVSGDINFVLDDNGGNSDVATATTTLSEGTYSFKVYNYGQAVTNGVKITDEGTKKLFGNYSTPLTLITSGGTYTFTFNKTTNEITIEMA